MDVSEQHRQKVMKFPSIESLKFMVDLMVCQKVIGVDSSARALETAVSNAAANNLDVTFERADAVKYMQQEITAGKGSRF